MTNKEKSSRERGGNERKIFGMKKIEIVKSTKKWERKERKVGREGKKDKRMRRSGEAERREIRGREVKR